MFTCAYNSSNSSWTCCSARGSLRVCCIRCSSQCRYVFVIDPARTRVLVTHSDESAICKWVSSSLRDYAPLVKSYRSSRTGIVYLLFLFKYKYDADG